MSRFWDRAREVEFYAWCDAADRLNAFVAALSALVYPGGLCNVSLWTIGTSERLWRDEILVDEVIAMTRAAFKAGTEVDVSFGARWRWMARLGLSLECFGEDYERRCPRGPLHVSPGEWKHIFPDCLEIAAGVRSVEVEVAIASMATQQETEDILLGLCVPDARAGVTTGCMTGGSWYAPIEAGATYHADAAMVGRDLALSWVYLHDGDRVGRVAGLSRNALMARVAAAPQGAHVGVATNVEHVYEHGRLDLAEPKPKDERPTHAGAIRHGPRARLPGDVELTREQVLAALSTPPATLLEALEASAVPDDEWRAVEPRALELIEARKQGAPTEEANVTTGKHARFIERHAPYHVRRLPNGGVVLATHPYRTLWPLWADALYLLGITP